MPDFCARADLFSESCDRGDVHGMSRVNDSLVLWGDGMCMVCSVRCAVVLGCVFVYDVVLCNGCDCAVMDKPAVACLVCDFVVGYCDVLLGVSLYGM